MNTPRQLHIFTLGIELQSPYLVHGNDPGRFGLDATLLRDQHDCPILPGTLVAGRIAEIWFNHGNELGSPDVNDWFGQPGNGTRGKVADDGGRRARLQVGDLRLQTIQIGQQPCQPWKSLANKRLTHTRIALDDASGSVQRGAMLVVEQVAEPGARLHFVGHWRAWTTPEEAKKLTLQLRAALLAQTQIGADRSVGLGVVLSATVQAKAAEQAANVRAKPANTGTCLRLTLTFDEPFCITERVHNGNLFKGGDVVPGGVILGALAHTLCSAYGKTNVSDLRERSALARHFDALRCTHAYPAQQTQEQQGQRPVPIPYSWVKANGRLQDAWQHGRPPPWLKEAPAFLLDWKATDFDAATKHTGWARVPSHLRVRTAMQDGRALDQSLFAIEGRFSPSDAPLNWFADFWLPDGLSSKDQADLLQEIALLTQAGLGPIGKTDAVAQVHLGSTTNTALANSSTAEPRQGDLIALRLNSPALLIDVVALADQPINVASKAYSEAFDDLLKQAGAPGALEFSHHFARERLVGGEAILNRYRLGQANGSPRTYRPLLLTEAGSVFVFRVKPSSDVRNVLQSWERNGLPLPKAVAQRYGATWQDHPYTPNSGYGEIAVHAAQIVPELDQPTEQQAQA